MSGWTYGVFGLEVEFPREVMTLRSAQVTPQRPADVRIAFAAVPPQPCMETVNDDLDVAWSTEGLTISVEEVGRFRVSNGDTVIVDPWPGATPAEIDLYLAGSVMGAVLHQRGMLPLHCNAFACDGRAILLCGDSGAGKSTLAAWFESRGYPLLTDDVCAVTFTREGRAVGHPGMPRLRLWDDARHAMGRSKAPVSSIPWAEGKFEIEMHADRVRAELPIAAIYHLLPAEPDDHFGIAGLHGLGAVDAITASIYRRRIADLAGGARRYLREAVELASSTPVFRISRTWGFEQFSAQSRQIETHFKSIFNEISSP